MTNYPHGKLNEEDEGELEMGIAADPEAKVVRLAFPKPVLWLALEKEEAIALGNLILEKARQL